VLDDTRVPIRERALWAADAGTGAPMLMAKSGAFLRQPAAG